MRTFQIKDDETGASVEQQEFKGVEMEVEKTIQGKPVKMKVMTVTVPDHFAAKLAVCGYEDITGLVPVKEEKKPAGPNK